MERLIIFSVKIDGCYVCKRCSYRGHVSEFRYACPRCGSIELEDESLYICSCCNQYFDWIDIKEHLKIEVICH